MIMTILVGGVSALFWFGGYVIRRKLVHVPAQIASSARRVTPHLPRAWPWEDAWTTLFAEPCAPPRPAATT
jgi:hypothetical protein